MWRQLRTKLNLKHRPSKRKKRGQKNNIMSFKIENKIVKVSKDCKTCEHINVCKYHAKMAQLCKSDEFYGMNKYLEWNNSLKAFELHASCQYFKLNYTIPEDDSLNLSVDKNIIDEIVRLERPEGLSSWCVKIEDNNVAFMFNSKDDVNVKITDLLAKYKFAPKTK
jgi:hypothetical protein